MRSALTWSRVRTHACYGGIYYIFTYWTKLYEVSVLKGYILFRHMMSSKLVLIKPIKMT